MSMRSARYLAAVLGSFAILLAACGQQPAGGGTASPSAGAKAAYGGTLTFALENDPANLDPMLSGLFVDRNIHYAMYDSLVRVDPQTVKFHLKSAFAPLLGALVDRAGMMVSRKVVEAVGADFTLKPFKAGTGPFILTEAVKNDHYTLEKNPDWWGKDANGNKLPYLDKVTVKIITDA